MGRSDLLIVIACRDEAATLGPVVAGARAFGRVLLVDDGSSDGSDAIARAAGAEVIAGPRQGYEAAVGAGLAAALARRSAFTVTLDADGEHDPASLAGFVAAFDRGADLICGVRAKPQRTAEYVVDAYARAAFGPKDILCGMKGYSRAVLERFADSGEALLLNMAPVVLWRAAGGNFVDAPVGGTPRANAPRFGRALSANLQILNTLPKLRALDARARRERGRR